MQMFHENIFIEGFLFWQLWTMQIVHANQRQRNQESVSKKESNLWITFDRAKCCQNAMWTMWTMWTMVFF
jgi:hypothetical protein